jgi:hypothetical protein
MKMKLNAVCAIIAITSSVWLNANEPVKPIQGSTELEKLKTLVGTWTGKTDMGQGPIDLTVQFRLLAGGSVVEERIFPGTPMEMVTMYFDKEGKLALTHYCVLGTRPGMVLKSSDAKTLRFDFDESCGIKPSQENHMHAMTLTFEDKDTIATSCKAVMDGKPVEAPPTTLKRAKS